MNVPKWHDVQSATLHLLEACLSTTNYPILASTVSKHHVSNPHAQVTSCRSGKIFSTGISTWAAQVWQVGSTKFTNKTNHCTRSSSPLFGNRWRYYGFPCALLWQIHAVGSGDCRGAISNSSFILWAYHIIVDKTYMVNSEPIQYSITIWFPIFEVALSWGCGINVAVLV